MGYAQRQFLPATDAGVRMVFFFSPLHLPYLPFFSRGIPVPFWSKRNTYPCRGRRAQIARRSDTRVEMSTSGRMMRERCGAVMLGVRRKVPAGSPHFGHGALSFASVTWTAVMSGIARYRDSSSATAASPKYTLQRDSLRLASLSCLLGQRLPELRNGDARRVHGKHPLSPTSGLPTARRSPFLQTAGWWSTCDDLGGPSKMR